MILGEMYMWKRINDFLAGIPMTIVGAVFLVLSFILSLNGIELMIDPAWITVIICGIPLLYLALWRVKYNPGISKISSALLISIAMFAAIAIGDLFAAGEVAFIMSVGSILEDMTTQRARKGLDQLIKLTPDTGRLINGSMIKVEDINIGDELRVLPGETIPIDGIIIKGETSIDQSIMTGESLPVDKTVGDEVYEGTMNSLGTIDIRATNVGEDSSLSKMIRLVEEAEKKKAPIARIADQWASWLVPIALLIAIVTYIMTGDITRGVTILVVFCPCALILATPTAIMAAIGQATKHGIIIKSGEAIEILGKVDTFSFDKTGTLTKGKLIVSDCIAYDEKMLQYCASLEKYSEHPLGKAVTDYYQGELLEVDDFKYINGKGIQGVLQKGARKKIYCGNLRFLKENDILISEDIMNHLERFNKQGKAIILTAVNGECIGLLALSDEVKEEAKETISQLKELGIESVLLSGDHLDTAQYFAKKVGIKNVKAELLPNDKVETIKELQKEHKVCMIGDGVNDAPALKIADVSISMGAIGSDIAIEASDIALMSDDLSKLPYLKRLANGTLQTIRFAISLSMTINFIAVTCSILGLLNPTTGALVHNCGSCFVVLIAALLYDHDFD